METEGSSAWGLLGVSRYGAEKPERTSLVARMGKNPSAMSETWVRSLGWKDSPGEGDGNPLRNSCLENSVDTGALWATVRGVTKSRTRLSNRHTKKSELGVRKLGSGAN